MEDTIYHEKLEPLCGFGREQIRISLLTCKINHSRPHFSTYVGFKLDV